MAEISATSRLDPEHVPFHENKRGITGSREACEEGETGAQTMAQIPSPQSYWAQSWQGKGGKWLRAPASQKSLSSPGFDSRRGSRPSSTRSCRLRHGARTPLAFPLHLPAAAWRALVSSVCAPGTCRPYNSPYLPLAMPLPTAEPTAAPLPPSTPTRPFFPER
jgi:hypothetical protein